MISCCFEVLGALGWREGLEEDAYFTPERIDAAMGGFFEQGFELGEELFNRIEVGGVSRQIT